MTFIPILNIVVPLFIFLYLIYKSRECSIYLVSLPLILALDRSIYLDIYKIQFEILGISLGIHDLFLAFQIIAWVYVVYTMPVTTSIKHSTGYKLAIGILFYYLFLIIISLPSLEKIMGRPIFYFSRMYLLPVGFLIMMDTYRRFSIEEVMTFLNDLRNIVLIPCILYIINGIYPGATYEFIEGLDRYDPITGTIRSYTFPAILYVLSLAITVGKMKFSFKELVIMLTMLTAGIFTFSRGLFLISIAVVILGRFFGSKKTAGNKLKIIQPIFTLILVASLLLITQIFFFPQYSFLLERLELLLFVGSDTNTLGRLDLLAISIKAAKENSILFGAGAYDTKNIYMWVMGSYDSDIYQIIARSGFIGLGIYMVVQVSALWGALSLMNRRTDKHFEVTAISILFLFEMLLHSIISTSYVHYPTITTIGFVFICIEAGQLWSQA